MKRSQLVCITAIATLVLAMGTGWRGDAQPPSPGPSASPLPSAPASPLPGPLTPSPNPVPTASASPSRPPSPAASISPNASPTPGPTKSPNASVLILNGNAAHDGLIPYARFIDGATSQTGLFTVWRKQGRVFFEIAPEQLDHTFLLAPQVASGLGKGLYAGLHLRDVLWKFHRVEDQIQSIEANPYAKVQPGAPAAAAVANAFPESIISTDTIMAVNPDNGHIVFGADALFSDIGYLSDIISYLSGPPFTRGYSLNRSLSYWGPTKAFPKNVDIELDLTLNGQGSLDTVPDPRSLFVRLHYSILDLPHDGYRPRLADDRVGYFITARRQFDDLADPGSFVRYIERWDIRKSDPAARVSRAKKPVIYYLSNDIPPRYRPAIRGALLTWNKAFEAVGITHAIQVRQQPKDPNWDPDDIRFSVVRWIVSTEPLFVSAAPVYVNPLTGEIIRADLVIDGSAIRSGKLIRDEIVDPTRALTPQQAQSCWQHDCDYALQMAQQQQWADVVLADEGVFASAQRPPDWFVEQYLRAVVLHESGHTLGLRHNFQASGLYSLGQLHDRRFTAAHGLGASVMDYLPVNLSPHGRPQADYYQTMLGPWDYFAIRYGYQPMPAANAEGERSALQRLASQATRPELAYATDEDNAWDDGFATDPRVNQFDLSDDPLGYAQQVLDIDQRLFATLPQRLPHYGASYAQARRAFEILLSNWWSVSRIATHYIGGEYFTRNHRGDPHARLPFTPVQRGQQQRAFGLLDRYVFGDGAFHFSPALINALGDDRFLHWGSNPNELGRLDFPTDEWVQAYQLALLAQMWQPSVLGRLASMETRVQRPGDTMSLADLYDWMDASMWRDLSGSGTRAVPRSHRALQHFYAELLVHIMLKPDPGTPSDARTLARQHLRLLQQRLGSALARGNYDEATSANFEDIEALVGRALGASLTAPAW